MKHPASETRSPSDLVGSVDRMTTAGDLDGHSKVLVAHMACCAKHSADFSQRVLLFFG